MVIAMNSSMGHFGKPVVIDFNIENSAVGGDIKTSAAPKSQEAKAGQPETPARPASARQEQVVPQQVEPTQATPQGEASPESQAPVAVSRPSADIQSAPGSSGASPMNEAKAAGKPSFSHGQGNSSEGMRQSYLKEHFAYIRDLVQKKLNYPKIARQMGWEGKVIISFIVCIDGHARDIIIKEGSGIELLDKNAVAAVQTASPFPKPPIEAQLIIPVKYTLN